MRTNIRVLGWLYIVLGILGVLAGLFVLLVMSSVGLFAAEREAFPVLFVVGAIVAGFTTLVSAPGIVVGIGLLQFRQWARVLALILGFLNLTLFPLGTILAIYTFVSLLNSDAEREFARS